MSGFFLDNRFKRNSHKQRLSFLHNTEVGDILMDVTIQLNDFTFRRLLVCLYSNCVLSFVFLKTAAFCFPHLLRSGNEVQMLVYIYYTCTNRDLCLIFNSPQPLSMQSLSFVFGVYSWILILVAGDRRTERVPCCTTCATVKDSEQVRQTVQKCINF